MRNSTKSLLAKGERSAFTLIEATVVLFIIALLLLLILPNLNRQRERAEATHRQAMVGRVQTQVDLYLNDHPDQKSVSFSDLRKGDYLTKEQMEKAQKLKIVIKGHDVKG
nr:competence protein ComGC [Fructobacillus durionis]